MDKRLDNFEYYYRFIEIVPGIIAIQEQFISYKASCFLLIDGKEGILIDALSGIFPDFIYQLERKFNIKIKNLYLTHAHYDHFNGYDKDLIENVYVHSSEAKWLKDYYLKIEEIRQEIDNNGKSKYPSFFNICDFDLKIISNYKELKDGDTINFGRFSLHVIHTPGHSPGSICFYEKSNKILFCGDTLYDGLIDVRDKCSNQAQYLHSLEKLAKLNVKLFVGSHEEPIIQKDKINVNNLMHFYKDLLLNKSSGKHFFGQKHIEFQL